MFDSLDEKMKLDGAVESTRKERVIEYLAIAVLSVLVFGGLYIGLMLLEG